MNKIQLVIELEYDDENMHGKDLESKTWFYTKVLGKDYGKTKAIQAEEDEELILHSNYIGDYVGTVRVLNRRFVEKDGEQVMIWN